MGARSGNNYLTALRNLRAEVWCGDRRIDDPSVAPGLMHAARAIASLYDLQSEHPEALTYRLAERNRAGLSFLQPTNAEELRRLGAMLLRWAEYSHGMIIEGPDRANRVIASLAAAADRLGVVEPRFAESLRNHYAAARDHDWYSVIAHPSNLASFTIDRTVAGIIVSGILLAPNGPLAEQLLVIHGPLPTSRDAELIFTIHCNTPSLRFFCPPDSSLPRSRFNAPIAARFGPVQSIAILDRVVVPWPRVFLDCHPANQPEIIEQSGAATALLHQRATRVVVQSGLMLGVAAMLAEASHEASFRYRNGLIDALGDLHQMRKALQSAELGGSPDAAGVFTPDRHRLREIFESFENFRKRAVSTIRGFAGDDLLALPSEADLANLSLDRNRVALLHLAREVIGVIEAEATREPSFARAADGASSDRHLPDELAALARQAEAFLQRRN